MSKQKEACPKKELHTVEPEGYVSWMEWAEKMNKTHTQKRCPGCDLYAIWVRREA